MRRLVVQGAMLQCDQGAAPCSLMVVPIGGDADALALATIDHHQPVNIATFGMCRVQANPAVAAATAAALGVPTPAPCVPLLATPWEDTSGGADLDGSALLVSDASVSCAYTGTITVADPATSVEIG
jgi:Domain of unknown function (DUF4280)